MFWESVGSLLAISCLFSNNKAGVRDVFVIIAVSEACTEIVFWVLI